MSLELPKYSTKDYLVLPMILIPSTIGTNIFILGNDYFKSISFFLASSALTSIFYIFYFVLCGGLAVTYKNKFPKDQQISIRLTLMISTFIFLSGFFLLILFKVYSLKPYFNVSFDQEAYLWSYYTLGIVNIFLTFLMESIARFERWNQNQKATINLREVYDRSRFIGLQSQVNPHFLFNSLNSLSSLISEDEEKAEHFLNEMTKVYRYMLRTETDTLVSLQTELNFINSYLYLLQERFGRGLQVRIDIADNYKEKFIAPLTLQTIIENTFNLNSITKSNPLIIEITGMDDKIKISNTIQPKNISDKIDFEAGLDNLLNKYKLLSKEGLIIKETTTERTIYLPLFLAEKEMLI